MGKLAAGLMAACLALAPGIALAVEPDEMLSDPRLEQRAQHVSKELRCVVCQNQNIDDSAAPLARDMRLLVRERLTAGDTDEQAKAYLVARYGNYVLLKPPFQPNTWLLWFGPFAILALATAGFVVASRSGAADTDDSNIEGEDDIAPYHKDPA
jgi:cytochrome c-type biogenesis protein CcmH